jgi:hypothetical protein
LALDIMTLAEWKTLSGHWSQIRGWGHQNLRAIDGALSQYELLPKHDLHARIRGLNQIMNVTEGYQNDKDVNSKVGFLQTRRENKVAAAAILFRQAEAKREYLASVLGIERNLGAFFGQGGMARRDQTPQERLRSIITSAANLSKYIGSASQGKQIDMTYWTEAIDPLHRHWGNPRNSPVFQAWTRQRWEGEAPGTTHSFFRWLETLTDQQVRLMLQGMDLLSTKYQDAVGREEYRVLVNENRLKYLAAPDDMQAWSTEEYETNFGGHGWCIFVMSLEGRLYANSHINEEGWFHSAFMGGKPVTAAGELWARNGRLYVMTDKSGHYKPGFQHLVDAAGELHRQGLDISRLQIWARHTQGGMAPRLGGIWYMAVDAEEHLRSNDISRSQLYDFGYAAGGIRQTFRGVIARENIVSIASTEADLGDKAKFQGCTCGARA